MLATRSLASFAVVAAVLATASPVLDDGEGGVLRAFFDVRLDCEEADGRVTLNEWAHFLQVMDRKTADGERVPLWMAQPSHAAHDVDGDGVVTWAEFLSAYRGVDAASKTPAQQVHLSLVAGSPRSMRVMWSTLGNLSAPAVVEYGLSPTALDSTSAPGTTRTYSVSALKGLLNYTSWPIHTVLLSDLKPATRYFYRVAAPGAGAWSATFNFSSAPPAATTASRWMVFGDQGVIPFGASVIKEMVAEHAAEPIDVVHLSGDVAYAGVNSWGAWQPTWAVYMNMIQPLAQSMPFQVAVGNHENYYNYTAFKTRFDLGPNDLNFWYSYDFAGVHVTVFSTEHPYDEGSPQRAWLEADLAAARASPTTKWLWLSGHRPLYSSDKSEWSSHRPGAYLLSQLEPLILKYGVDVVHTGHMHCYESTFPVLNGTVTSTNTTTYFAPKAPLYVVQGTAGALIFETWVDPQPAWSRKRIQEYGYGIVDVREATQPGYQTQLTYTFKKDRNTVLDTFTIVK